MWRYLYVAEWNNVYNFVIAGEALAHRSETRLNIILKYYEWGETKINRLNECT